MRYPVAYYLLLLYCTLMVRCAMPVACDALSHIFNEEDHIAVVHAVYGSHHLQAEVANTVSDNPSGKHTTAPQQNEPTVVHTFTRGYICSFISKAIRSSFFTLSADLLSDAFTGDVNQPPESC